MVYSVKQFTLQHCAVIFIFEKNMKFPLLLDIYGVLLSDKKREIVEYYYNEDYSLSEISEITGISRQGVRDSIKKSEEEIYSLEEKLGIAAKNLMLSNQIDSIERDISSGRVDAEKLKKELEVIRCVIRPGEEPQETT